MNDRKVIKLNHAARMFGVPFKWLREQVESGLIPAVKADRTYLVLPEKVEAFLVQQAAHAVSKRSQTVLSGGVK